MRSLYQKNWILYSVIILVTSIVWYKILSQTFLSEGYMYFNKNLSLLSGFSLSGLSDYDNIAKLFFDITIPIFKDNLVLYQVSALVMLVVFSLSFFTILFKITKSKLVGFFSVIFFSTNYVSLFEYMANGNYQRFIQRFPTLIPLIFSFYFLWKAFVKENIKKRNIYIVVSFALYAAAVVMSHFATISLPLFVIFPLVQTLESKKHKDIFLRGFVIFIYLFLSYFITRHGAQHPDQTPLQFLTTEKDLVLRVLYQLPMITIPLNLITFIAPRLSPPIPDPYTSLMNVFTVLCLLFYLGGAYLVSRRLPKQFNLYLVFLLSMFSTMFFYIYIDPRLNPVKYFGEDRYYLFPVLFATVLWGLIVKAILATKKKRYLTFLSIVLVLYVINNACLINNQMGQIQYKSEMNKKLFSYLKANSDMFGMNSTLILPYYLSWPSSYINRFILPNTNIILPADNWEKINWPNKNNVFVLDYDYEHEPGKDFDLQKGRLIDLTKKYREGEKIIFLN